MTKEIKYKHIIDQILTEQQDKKDNGPIEVTVDQLWKYSGAVEEDSEEYTALCKELEFNNKYALTIEAIRYLRAKRWYKGKFKTKHEKIKCYD